MCVRLSPLHAPTSVLLSQYALNDSDTELGRSHTKALYLGVNGLPTGVKKKADSRSEGGSCGQPWWVTEGPIGVETA